MLTSKWYNYVYLQQINPILFFQFAEAIDWSNKLLVTFSVSKAQILVKNAINVR